MIPHASPPGKRLKVNAVTSRTGWVKDRGGGRRRPEPAADCVPIVGDQPWTRVTWKGTNDLGTGQKSVVTLRVEMKQAKVFGLEID